MVLETLITRILSKIDKVSQELVDIACFCEGYKYVGDYHDI